MANKSYPTADFTAISIDVPIDIVIESGPCAATATAAADIPPELLVFVKNATLVVEANGSIVTSGITLRILVSDLQYIEISKAASVRIEKIDAPALSIESTSPASIALHGGLQSRLDLMLGGAEDVLLAGSSEKLTLLIKKSADLDGRAHPAKDATITVEKDGSALVNVQGTLNVKIPGAGSVKYVGNPVITKSVSNVADFGPVH